MVFLFTIGTVFLFTVGIVIHFNISKTIKSSKAIGQKARAHDVHPVTIHNWRKELMEKGPEIFGQKTTIHEYENKIRELEQLIGHKKAKIALIKNFLTGASPEKRRLI